MFFPVLSLALALLTGLATAERKFLLVGGFNGFGNFTGPLFPPGMEMYYPDSPEKNFAFITNNPPKHYRFYSAEAVKMGQDDVIVFANAHLAPDLTPMNETAFYIPRFSVYAEGPPLLREGPGSCYGIPASTVINNTLYLCCHYNHPDTGFSTSIQCRCLRSDKWEVCLRTNVSREAGLTTDAQTTLMATKNNIYVMYMDGSWDRPVTILMLKLNHETNSWVSCAPPPIEDVWLYQIASVDGHVFLCGGQIEWKKGEWKNSSQCFEYSEMDDEWRRLPDMPHPTYPDCAENNCIPDFFMLADGHELFVFVGNHEVFVFDLFEGKWRETAPTKYPYYFYGGYQIGSNQ